MAKQRRTVLLPIAAKDRLGTTHPGDRMTRVIRDATQRAPVACSGSAHQRSTSQAHFARDYEQTSESGAAKTDRSVNSPHQAWALVVECPTGNQELHRRGVVAGTEAMLLVQFVRFGDLIHVD